MSAGAACEVRFLGIHYTFSFVRVVVIVVIVSNTVWGSCDPHTNKVWYTNMYRTMIHNSVGRVMVLTKTAKHVNIGL